MIMKPRINLLVRMMLIIITAGYIVCEEIPGGGAANGTDEYILLDYAPGEPEFQYGVGAADDVNRTGMMMEEIVEYVEPEPIAPLAPPFAPAEPSTQPSQVGGDSKEDILDPPQDDAILPPIQLNASYFLPGGDCYKVCLKNKFYYKKRNTYCSPGYEFYDRSYCQLRPGYSEKWNVECCRIGTKHWQHIQRLERIVKYLMFRSSGKQQ